MNTHFFYREFFFSEESEMFSMRFSLSVSGYVLYSTKWSLTSESESEMFSICNKFALKFSLRN